jgi:hypothetical protein
MGLRPARSRPLPTTPMNTTGVDFPAPIATLPVSLRVREAICPARELSKFGAGATFTNAFAVTQVSSAERSRRSRMSGWLLNREPRRQTRLPGIANEKVMPAPSSFQLQPDPCQQKDRIMLFNPSRHRKHVLEEV